MAARNDNSTLRQIRHVQSALEREFDGLIDVSDVTVGENRDGQWLSRALAAKAVSHLTGMSAEDAAATVIDGRNDYGIDAVAVSPHAPELWLVQAKWSDVYKGSCNTDVANKMVRAFRLMDERAFERFNERFQAMSDQITEVLEHSGCKVVFVLALMGPGELSSDVVEIFEDAGREFNLLGPGLEYEVLNGEAFYRIIRDDIATPPIELTVRLAGGWYQRNLPVEAYVGDVSADQLADWHREHASRGLYRDNLRTSLGRTSVNQGLVTSYTTGADRFWYLHNGITVVCKSVEKRFFGKRAVGEPVELRLVNASVVNGAQTVTSAYKAAEEAPDAVAEASVNVRIICAKNDPEFSRVVTIATNTQNGIERRDYVATEPVQLAIQQDFRLSDREYTLKRGELEPAPEAGCSVDEAAVALACAHPNPLIPLRARRQALLWETGQRGAYDQLFGQQPTADEIWRWVSLLRAVRKQLAALAPTLENRPARIADEAQLLIAHIAFRLAGREGVDDPGPTSHWDAALETVPPRVGALLAALVNEMNEEYGSGSAISPTFANEQRWSTLAERTLAAVSSAGDGNTASIVRSRKPRAQRRPNSVSLVVDAGLINDGTRVTFKTASDAEREYMDPWLAADPQRGTATWVNDRTKPLIWAADGERYSPSGLITHMWELAQWRDSWVAVQGPRQWIVEGHGLLVDLAAQIWRALNEADEDQDEEG